MMTLTNWQSLLHKLYQGDTDVPTSSEEAYTVRTALLEMAIRTWDGEEGILWRELWKQLSDASDGTKTTVASTTTYNCPSDMRRFLGGYVRTTDSAGTHTFYPVVEQHKAELFLNEDEELCWFTGSYTGSAGGFVLHFLEAPTAGLTINYPYYKVPTYPSSASDVIEMSDPLFAIEMALAKLHELDGEGDRATLALAKATSRLKAMKINNAMPGWYQDNYAPDRELEIGVSGFGE